MFSDFLVYIDCPTFNHSQFIRETMEGFSIQKTDFPFVCGIVDDDSSDGAQIVIQQYLEEFFDLNVENGANKEDTKDYSIVFAQHKNNRNCFFLVVLHKYNYYSLNKTRFQDVAKWKNNAKYIAICEGDDYWNDPLKLKKQVAFLDAHPTIGMCYTKCRYYYQDKGVFASKSWGGDAEDFETIVQSNPVPTMSAMYRQGLHEKYEKDVDPINKGWMLGDYPFWIWISKEYGIKFMNEETCIYRVLEKSASHRDDRQMREAFIKSVCGIQRYFVERYNQNDLICKDKEERALLMDAFSRKDYETVVYYYHFIKHPGVKYRMKFLLSKLFLLIP